MDTHLRQTLTKAIALILRPLIRLWVKKGFSYNAFERVMRWVFVDVIDKEFRLAGRKQTDSRIAVISGLTRHQVCHLRSINLEESPEEAKSNRATRVLTGWMSDPEYLDGEGEALALPLEGDVAPSFASLVKKYGGDISPRAVLDELVNQDSAVRTGDSGVKLATRGYVPTNDESAIIEIFGYDAAALISTLEHNLGSEPGKKRFQKKVCYENIPAGYAEQFRVKAGKKAQKLLEELNDSLSRAYEKKPEPRKDYREVGMGIYYFEKDEP